LPADISQQMTSPACCLVALQKVDLKVKLLVMFRSTIHRGFEEKVRSSWPVILRCSSEAFVTGNALCDRSVATECYLSRILSLNL
jgi:hypothetical protein